MTRFSDLDPDGIEAQAAHWFARNRNDQNSATRKAFATWLAEPAHARAYGEFEELWADLNALKQLNRPSVLPSRQRPSQWLRPALAVAAALVCAVLAFNLGPPGELYQQHIQAQTKGSRQLDLPDGSRLFVNANTRLRIDFDRQQRTVYLDQGQLYLEVAPDKERPLLVQAGEATVRVVGTAFDVRRGARQLVVSVAHGQVAFATDRRKDTTQMLGASQRATWDYARGTLRQQTVNPEEVADWRSGHLSFRNRELASLIDELELYRPGSVLLADGPLTRYKVSGSLDINDPDALIKALPALLPVKTVAQADGSVRIENRN